MCRFMRKTSKVWKYSCELPEVHQTFEVYIPYLKSLALWQRL